MVGRHAIIALAALVPIGWLASCGNDDDGESASGRSPEFYQAIDEMLGGGVLSEDGREIFSVVGCTAAELDRMSAWVVFDTTDEQRTRFEQIRRELDPVDVLRLLAVRFCASYDQFYNSA